jgi:hypothetical protein
MRRLVLVMLLLAGPAVAQGQKQSGVQDPGPKGPAPAVDAVAGLPAELAGWTRGPVTEFEARPGGTGLGAAIEYRPAVGGGVATVYRYDRGETAMHDGTAAPEVAREIRTAVGEVEAVGPTRRFTVAERRPETEVAGQSGRPALRCQPLVLAFAGGQRADSFVCVGVVGSRFLKLRMTLPAATEDFSMKATAAFAQALLAVVQPAPPPAPMAKRLVR